ncbi:MAG: RHS repeat-associated core domain-containing protein, partial [Bacteroidota bacterium]
FSSTPQGQALFSGPTSYGYQYDNFNRLTHANANVGIGGDAVENVDGDLSALGDVSFTYDLIGNITAINRSVLVDELNAIGEEVFAFNLNQANNKIIDVSVSGNVTNEGTFTYSFDGAGNLLEDNRKGISDLIYTRGKYTSRAAGTNYLYDINDARVHKTGPTENTFYLRNGGGQEIATIDLDTDEPTWYVYGLDRVAKIGPDGSLCDPPLCRPSAPVDPNANITEASMLAIFNAFVSADLTYPATLFRLQLADDQDYYVLDRELALIPSRFQILQQIVIYSENEMLDWRSHSGGGQTNTSTINIIDFLEDRTGLPTDYLLNDYHVCDEVCLTDVFQCDEDTKDKQIDYLTDAYTEATTGQIDLSSDRHLYRVRLCGGAEVYIMESQLAALEKSFLVVQDIIIEDYNNQLFSYSLNDAPQPPATIASLLVHFYNPSVDIIIDEYEPCTVEPVCVDENQACTPGFDPEVLQTELLAIAAQGPANHSGLSYPLDLMRLRFCNGVEYYLLDSEIGQLPAYNYEIVQTIRLTSSTTSIVMDDDGESRNVLLNLVLQERADGRPLLLDNFPDCDGSSSCLPPICDKTTETDQDVYINGILPSTSRTNHLTYPHTLTRILLCSGLSVYLTEDELSNMPNQAYTIQHELIVTDASELLDVRFADNQTGIFTLSELLTRNSIWDIFIVGDYIPCDDNSTDQCILNFPCLETNPWQIAALNNIATACQNGTNNSFPITLFRVETTCGGGIPTAIYLTEDEIAQLPGYYNITQTVLLDSPSSSIQIIRDGDLESVQQSVLVQACSRFAGVTAIEYGGCQIKEIEIGGGTGLRMNNEQGTICETTYSITDLDLQQAADDAFDLQIIGQANKERNCEPASSTESVSIKDEVYIDQCAQINYRAMQGSQQPFIAVSRTKVSTGYPIGLVSADYLRRSYPDLESSLQIDLGDFFFADQAIKDEWLTKVLNYSLSVEWGRITDGIDVPMVLPQVDISLGSGRVQLCLSGTDQDQSSSLRMSTNGILIPPFQSVTEDLEMAPLGINLSGVRYPIQEGVNDICPTILIGGQEMPVKIRLVNDNGLLDITLLEPISYTTTTSVPGADLLKAGGDETPEYYLECANPSKIQCYNGNCDDVCNDLATGETCTPGELVMLNLLLTQIDVAIANVVVEDLQFPLRLNTVRFCNGIQRILFDGEIANLSNVAYEIISQQWVADKETALVLLDGGQNTTGDIEDLLVIRPQNDDLGVMVADDSPTGPEAYDPIDPVTGQDPANPVMEVTTPVSYYLYDHLGNTRMIVRADDAAAMTITYAADYYPYGKILREWAPCEAERFLTTQHERDSESGYDNRGARLYDADVGRFLSVDPLAQEYPSLSGYAYVKGNPISYLDPDGRRTFY